MDPSDTPVSENSMELSGVEEIYDDGLVRVHLPAEFMPVEDGDAEAVRFQFGEFPFGIFWSTMILNEDEMKQLGGPWGDLEDAMRFFLKDLSPDEIRSPVPLGNKFHIAGNSGIQDGESRSRCLLGAFVGEEHLLFTWMELAAPVGWEDEPTLLLIRHILRKSLRQAECSLGGPRINTSRAWLDVECLGVRFPEELGGMGYRFVTDYECDREGEGVSLRYTDDEGRRADVYIYTNCEELIEPGVQSNLVKTQMDEAVQQFLGACAPRSVRSGVDAVTVYGRGEIPFLDRRVLFEAEIPLEGDLVTAILLMGRLDAFIKVRFTPLPGETHHRHPLLDSLMSDLANALGA